MASIPGQRAPHQCSPLPYPPPLHNPEHRRPLSTQSQRTELMPPAGPCPMESAGPARGCGQPVDSPDAISFDHAIPATTPNILSDPACPHPPHNPFGQVRDPAPTALSPHRSCQLQTSEIQRKGALPHSPSAELNQHSRAALSTGPIVAVEIDSGKAIQETRPANHAPA